MKTFVKEVFEPKEVVNKNVEELKKVLEPLKKQLYSVNKSIVDLYNDQFIEAKIEELSSYEVLLENYEELVHITNLVYYQEIVNYYQDIVDRLRYSVNSNSPLTVGVEVYEFAKQQLEEFENKLGYYKGFLSTEKLKKD